MLKRVLVIGIGAALFAPGGARADSVALQWTAPGDDGNVGRATSYELRYSKSSVPVDTTGWWGAATSAGALPQPLTAGSRESFTVAGLDSNATYYFIIRTADEVPNVSGYSNVAVKATGSSGTTLVTPTGFAAQNVSNGVRLTWNRVTTGNASGYHVYRRVGSGGIGALMLTAPLTQTSWTDSTTAAGTTYEYSIATYSGASESAPATATVTTPGGTSVVASAPFVGYPNPARSHVTFRFRAGTAEGAPGQTRLIVYDLNGRLIRTVVNGVLPSGDTSIDWPCVTDAGRPVSPGLYNAILESPSGRQTMRVAIVP